MSTCAWTYTIMVLILSVPKHYSIVLAWLSKLAVIMCSSGLCAWMHDLVSVHHFTINVVYIA